MRSQPRYSPWPQRFWEKVSKSDDRDKCWLWTGSVGGHGYGQIHKDGKPRTAHRLSYQLSVGEIPDGMHVLHRCDVRACCNPNHLFIGSNRENMLDKISKGRHNAPRGERSPKAKLTEDDIKQIRGINLESEKIGRIYGVSGHQVGLIKRLQSWRHI